MYIQLPFGVALAGDMFQRKRKRCFGGCQLYLALQILIEGFNVMGRDNDATLNKVLRICRQANLKLNKDKCLF